MTITNKDSILKKYYELNGQQTMFGYDNLEFKTINHPTPHRFVDLCPEFKLKKTKRSLISLITPSAIFLLFLLSLLSSDENQCKHSLIDFLVILPI